MQKNLYLLFLVLVLGYSVHSLAEDKLYVNPEDVVIDQNGIFVNYEGNVISANNLTYDEKGIYLLFSDIAKLNELKAWICQNCFHPNMPWREECYKCRGPRTKYDKD